MQKTRWLGAFLALTLSVLAGVGTAVADDELLTSVEIQGEPVVGGTLDAIVVVNGLDPTITYQWARCDAADTKLCEDIPGETAPSYAVADGDLGSRLRVRVTVTIADETDSGRSGATAVVAPPPPPPPPPDPAPPPPDPTPPPPDPTPPPPDPAPLPPPADPAPLPPQPAPATTTDPAVFTSTTPQDPGTSVVTPTAPLTPPAFAPRLTVAPVKSVRYLRPFPVVRVAGLGVAGGAYIDLLRVTASRGTKVSVDCRGLGCPVRQLALRPGRIRELERFLPAGVVITIRVTRTGYVGKYVRFVIRKAAAPERRDACLVPGRTRPAACTG